MARPSFIRRTLDSLNGGAKLGASIGVTAGMMSVFLMPAAYAGIGSILIPPLIGYAAGMAIGGIFFSGAQVTSDIASTIVAPFFPSRRHGHAREHAIGDTEVAKIVARERKAARAEAIAEIAEANDRKTNHAQRVTASRGSTVNINHRA